SAWHSAPGFPFAYVSPTKFSVTGNRVAEFLPLTAVRFYTSTAPAVFTYTTVASYDTSTNQVTVADPVVGSGGLCGVEVSRTVDAIKIKSLHDHSVAPLDQMIRNVVLHWFPIGRALAGTQKFTPREYTQTSTARCTGLGQDRHLFSQWIRDQSIAEK